MKKLLSILAVAATLTACGPSDFKITANLDSDAANGKQAYLINYDSGDTIDSAMVTNKQVVFVGKVKKPYVGRILAATGRATFIVEGGDIVFDWKNDVAKGTALNDSLTAFLTEQQNMFGDLVKKSEAEKWSDEKLAAEYKKMDAKMNDIILAHYAANKKNPFGWWTFYQYLVQNNFGLEELNAKIAEAPKNYSESVRIQKLISAAKQVELTKVGQKMVDFSVKSEDGIEVKLSDFVGKGDVVVVDFWASWCGPCRREANTTIRQIYDKYHGKGLKVLGVAVWDKPDDTFKAISDMNMPWPQIINAKNIASDIYGFNAIPHIIVFSGDGTILSRGLQGDELMNKVDSVMGAK